MYDFSCFHKKKRHSKDYMTVKLLVSLNLIDKWLQFSEIIWCQPWQQFAIKDASYVTAAECQTASLPCLFICSCFCTGKLKTGLLQRHMDRSTQTLKRKTLISYPSYNCSVKLYICTVYRMRLHTGSTSGVAFIRQPLSVPWSLLALMLHEWHFS